MKVTNKSNAACKIDCEAILMRSVQKPPSQTNPQPVAITPSIAMAKGLLLTATFLIVASQLLIRCEGQTRRSQPRELTDVSIDNVENIQAHSSSEREKISHAFKEDSKEILRHRDIVRLNRVSPIQVHDVIFVVKQRNMDELLRILEDVSDFTSPNYGKHMTSEEIADLTSNPNSRNKIVEYLEMAGASVVGESLYGEYITASASVSVWEHMLNTEFYTYAVLPADREEVNYRIEDDKSVKHYIRTDKYSVPTFLDEHIESVMNTIQLPPMQQRKQAPRVLSKDEARSHAQSRFSTEAISSQVRGYIYPAYFNYIYNIDSNVGHPRATQAVFASYGQHYSPSDLRKFQRTWGIPDNPINISLANKTMSVDTCRANIRYCAEGCLDTQWIMAVSQAPTTYYYTELGLTSEWLTEMANMKNPPLVVSISYGANEDNVSSGEIIAFDTQAMKLGVMGVTITASTGDDGANYYYSKYGQPCAYVAVFPASSPYVLAIGSTQVFDANYV